MKPDDMPAKTFWLGLCACIASIFIVRAIVLKKTLSLSIYDLRYPDDNGLRIFWVIVAIFILVAFPVMMGSQIM
jgi:hypothetical protein